MADTLLAMMTAMSRVRWLCMMIFIIEANLSLKTVLLSGLPQNRVSLENTWKHAPLYAVKCLAESVFTMYSQASHVNVSLT
jgi:hypothetical protein